MTVHFLLDAVSVQEGVKLLFFNSQSGEIKEVLDKDYRPYFFVPYPPSQLDKKIIGELSAETSVQEKEELFSNQSVKVTKVELEGSSDPRWVSERFKQSWEGEVPLVLSYAYDHNLVFGSQHSFQEDNAYPIYEVPEDTKVSFKGEFSDVKQSDPAKYELLERWFTLCSQPVPEIPLEKLGIGGNVKPEKYYLSFMLSRVANLPVPQAYSNSQVSTWLRSILHNHLRRSNVLIPTSKELRHGETKRGVQGALTFPPETGVYFNTMVVDFESLYPSLIDVCNLSYETINCSHSECWENKLPNVEHHVCQLRRGVYSVLIGSIKDLRIRWYKPLARDRTVPAEERRLAKATSQLLKLILVSAYGVAVRMHGLAYPSLAESITACGRYSLQTTWDMAKKFGLHPIYGDTDSLFLDDPREEQVEQLIRTVKERLRLDLALDERYSLCVLPRAMKAYFGMRKDGTPDIKGVTAIKSSSPNFIQKVFRNCVKEMTEIKNYSEYEASKHSVQRVVREAIKNLKSGDVLLKDLEYPVEIHEDPTEKMREKVFHQPYQCAIQLIDSGKLVQKYDTVRFIKVKPFLYRGRTFTVKPIEQVRDFSDVNLEDYVRNLRTSLNQTFRPMNIIFKEEGERKVTLADFI